MYLITDRTLDRFAQEHANVRDQLAEWRAMVRAARWVDPEAAQRSSRFPVRTLPGARLLFNIKGNEFRLICSVQYADPDQGLNGIVRLHWFGPHSEYNRIDALTVDLPATQKKR